MRQMDIKEAKKALMELQSRLSAYSHAMSLINFDGATTAPGGTAENRAHALGILSAESYKISTAEETVSLLEYLDENRDELTDKEKRMVYLLLKDIRKKKKIPMEEYIGYRKLLVMSDAVWHKAKEQSDFAMFEPYLEKIFAAAARFAAYLEPDKDPYDHWLGEYEEGLTMEKCDSFFSVVRTGIVPVIKAIQEAPQVDDSCLYGAIEDSRQEKLARDVMKIMGIDMEHCGLSTTEHPFTTSIGSRNDVRITTKYRDNFAASFFSVMHEGGHALYNLNSADDLAYTVLDGGVSMAMHESQSRFYENILGRSREFIGYLHPLFAEAFPENMKGVSALQLWKAVNKARPSLVRIEADEITYCLHIMIRYELEKRLLRGELSVRDLPGEWNRLYREYLGLEIPDDRRGVLQDSHWSTGLIGYFPSYALGSAYGAQLLRSMKRDVDVEGCMARGEFAPVNAWLRERIWKYGKTVRADELLEKALGEPFDPNVYCDYLKEKAAAVYGL